MNFLSFSCYFGKITTIFCPFCQENAFLEQFEFIKWIWIFAVLLKILFCLSLHPYMIASQSWSWMFVLTCLSVEIILYMYIYSTIIVECFFQSPIHIIKMCILAHASSCFSFAQKIVENKSVVLRISKIFRYLWWKNIQFSIRFQTKMCEDWYSRVLMIRQSTQALMISRFFPLFWSMH